MPEILNKAANFVANSPLVMLIIIVVFMLAFKFLGKNKINPSGDDSSEFDDM